MKMLLALLALFAIPTLADSNLPPAYWANRELPDSRQEAKAQALMEELRCLVCQGQSIADSDADLAGDMEEVDVPSELAQLKDCGPQCKMMDTSFFLARQTLLASSRPGMAIWREKLFAWMLRNAESAMEFFKLPTNRVVELGSQLEI